MRKEFRCPLSRIPRSQGHPSRGISTRPGDGRPARCCGGFFQPSIHIGFGCAFSGGAVVPMPEAAVNKDDFLSGREYQIGFSGEVFSVKAEMVSDTVNQRPELEFGRCVFLPNPAHNPASFLARENIGHRATSIFRLGSVSHSSTIALYSEMSCSVVVRRPAWANLPIS